MNKLEPLIKKIIIKDSIQVNFMVFIVTVQGTAELLVVYIVQIEIENTSKLRLR